MEGNTLMDELRETVLRLLRSGSTPDVVCLFLDQLRQEIDAAKDYIYAIEEAKFRP